MIPVFTFFWNFFRDFLSEIWLRSLILINFREFASYFCLYRKSCWQKIIQILHTKQYVNWQRIEMNRRIKMSRWFADYEDFGKSWFLLRFFDTVKYLDFCKVWLNVWGDPHHLLLCVFLVCCKMIKNKYFSQKIQINLFQCQKWSPDFYYRVSQQVLNWKEIVKLNKDLHCFDKM